MGLRERWGCQDYRRLNREEISLFATRLVPFEHLQSLIRIEHIGLSRIKTADSSGIQDYHWNGLAICEECFEAQSF